MNNKLNNFQVSVDQSDYTLAPSELATLDLIETGNNLYHVIEGQQSYAIQIHQIDINQKQVHLTVNGNDYHLSIQDHFDQLVTNMGLDAQEDAFQSNINAPMPGLIVDILVEEGQSVEKGTPLLILEAMKMENMIKSEGTGTVKSIEIKKGDSVEKGQLLLEME